MLPGQSPLSLLLKSLENGPGLAPLWDPRAFGPSAGGEGGRENTKIDGDWKRSTSEVHTRVPTIHRIPRKQGN